MHAGGRRGIIPASSKIVSGHRFFFSRTRKPDGSFSVGLSFFQQSRPETNGFQAMPTKPARPCKRCRKPTRNSSGYCDRCEPKRKQADRDRDKRRGSAASRGYGSRWQRARSAFLTAHPLCAECQQRGRVTVATDVDHIRPHKGDPVLFWDRNNWQALCHACHSRKTASEDGGFGND